LSPKRKKTVKKPKPEPHLPITPEVGRADIKDFTFGGSLGEGAYGRVFLATDNKT